MGGDQTVHCTKKLNFTGMFICVNGHARHNNLHSSSPSNKCPSYQIAIYVDQTSTDILYMSHLSLKHVHIMHALSIYNTYIIACICDIILEQVNYTYMYIHM